MNVIRLLLSILIATVLCLGIGLDFADWYINRPDVPIANELPLSIALFVISALLLWFLPVRPHRKYAFLTSGFLLLAMAIVAYWEANGTASLLADPSLELSKALSPRDLLALKHSAEKDRMNSYFMSAVSFLLLLFGGAAAWSGSSKSAAG